MADPSTPAGTALGSHYGHTNLVARNWRTLAAFYERVFGCEPVPPERNYRGQDLERGTAVPGAALTGVHLRLPGRRTQRPDARDLHVRASPRRSAVGRESARLGPHRLRRR